MILFFPTGKMENLDLDLPARENLWWILQENSKECSGAVLRESKQRGMLVLYLLVFCLLVLHQLRHHLVKHRA